MNRIARAFLRRSRMRSDVSEEIQQHLAEKADAFREQGLSPGDALAAARREFGNAMLIEERSREVWNISIFESLASDLRYAARQLRKSPAFAIAAVVTLALGIGASTAIFSVIDAVLLRPLPFAGPSQLLAVQAPTSISYPNFFDFRTGNHVFEHLVSYRDSEFTLVRQGKSLHLDGEVVSWDLFPLLGVQPARGRGFLPNEEKPDANVVVLSHELWKDQFAADPAIIGRSINIDSKAFTVVGVAPKNFRFPVENREVQMWTTLAQDSVADPPYHPLSIQRGARVLDAIGRLKKGVTLAQAQSQMAAIAARLQKEYPEDNRNVGKLHIRPALEVLTGYARTPLLILMGAVGLLLVIACTNVANLVLSRTTERVREFALRAAIGASKSVILRQVFVESFLLGAFGSAGGIALAVIWLRLLVPLASDKIPRLEDAHIDIEVLGFSIALAFITALVFSLAPMAQLSKLSPAEAIKERTHGIAAGHDRIRGALVVAQVALGLVLLSGASLLTAAFLAFANRNPGFKPDHLLTFHISLPQNGWNMAQQVGFAGRFLERMSAIPGVVSAASGWPLPLEGNQVTVRFSIEGRPATRIDRPPADLAIVSPGFFRTMGIPFLRGRAFTARDDADAPPVVIVNEAFARKFFPGEDAIGKRIQSGAENGRGPQIQTIVAVVGNAKQSPLFSDDEPIYYFPYKQLSWDIGSIILRTAVPPYSVESAARKALAELDPQIPMFKVRTMDEFISTTIALPRFQMLLLGSFAGIALLLTLVGLYGVMMYSVSKRTRDIGVRIAVGATPGAVLEMIFSQAMLLLGAGLVIGIAGAAAANRLFERMLYGVHPHSAILLASAVMVVTGLIAAWFPARHAASIDAIEALRIE